MHDPEFKKQLEQFGTEAIRLVRGDISKKRQQDRQEATNTIIKFLMERVEGRQWAYAQLDMCRVFSSPFVAGQSDVTSVLMGLQMYGHTLLADIMAAAPEQFYVMNQEENARRQAVESQDQ